MVGSRKIAHELIEMIRSGDVAAGAYLPSTRELAERYGVSLNTVHAAVRELAGRKLVECRPRRGAVVLEPRRAAAGKVKRIAVAALATFDPQFGSDWRMEWSWAIWNAMRGEILQAGLSVEMIPFKQEQEECSRWLERIGEPPAGVVLPGHTADGKFIAELQKRDIPWVSINRPGHDGNCNYVSADYQSGCEQAGRLFADRGFERVLILTTDSRLLESDLEKVTGFFQGYLASGAATSGLRVVRCDDITELAGYRAVRKAWETGERFQGIFAVGDLLAMGAVQALRDEGLGVPADVSVAGATGLTRSGEFDPPLTVVRQPMEEIGQNAGRMLVQMVREGVRKFAPRRLPCELIVRKSTAVAQARGVIEKVDSDTGGVRP